MGRALFSTRRSTPAVRESPEPSERPQAQYTTWSIHNKFDPDSDEFFRDAVYEAFLDTAADSNPALLDASDANSSNDGIDNGYIIPMTVEPLPIVPESQYRTVDHTWFISADSPQEEQENREEEAAPSPQQTTVSPIDIPRYSAPSESAGISYGSFPTSLPSPPNASPRLYTWRRAVPVPTSPNPRLESLFNTGPMQNSAPVRVRVQGFAM